VELRAHELIATNGYPSPAPVGDRSDIILGSYETVQNWLKKLHIKFEEQDKVCGYLLPIIEFAKKKKKKKMKPTQAQMMKISER
jgi:hypothetical protein